MAPREFFEALPSTQDRAIELARSGAPAGTTVVARSQTAGYGRRGRSWISPPGGLYLSLVLGDPPAAPGLVSLGVGALVAEALDARYRVRVLLKWPNDLVVASPGSGARKLGGILVDRVATADGRPVDVVGIGVNAAAPDGGWPRGLSYPAVGLNELAEGPVDLPELERSVVAAAASARAVLDAPQGAASIVARVRTRLHGLGRRVALDGRSVGRLAGVAEDGAVAIDAANGPLEARAGELAFLEEGA